MASFSSAPRETRPPPPSWRAGPRARTGDFIVAPADWEHPDQAKFDAENARLIKQYKAKHQERILEAEAAGKVIRSATTLEEIAQLAPNFSVREMPYMGKVLYWKGDEYTYANPKGGFV